jgi:hypothetical protein
MARSRGAEVLCQPLVNADDWRLKGVRCDVEWGEALGATPPAGDKLLGDVHVVDLALRGWDWQAVCSQAFDMKRDRLTNFSFDLGNRGASRDTAWQVRHVGGMVALGLFNHDRVAHMTSQRQSRPPEDAVQGPVL